MRPKHQLLVPQTACLVLQQLKLLSLLLNHRPKLTTNVRLSLFLVTKKLLFFVEKGQTISIFEEPKEEKKIKKSPKKETK